MQRELTEDPVLVRERASATLGSLGEPAPYEGSAAAENRVRLPEGPLTLADQQFWFVSAVTSDPALPLPFDEGSAARLVNADVRLSAGERLDLYRQSYQARLLECLADDFPVVQHALGEHDFAAVCRGYIHENPSRSPNLNRFGQGFAGYVRGSGRALIADLAELEWAIVMAVHAPTRPPMTQADVARIAPEHFAGARLVVNPSLVILHLGYPVNTYFQRVRNGEDPSRPEPEPTFVAVYRTERRVYRMQLSAAMATLFESLAHGATLVAALDAALPHLEHTGQSQAELAQVVLQGFRSGVESGLFAAILPGPAFQ